jgi:8-oxo-dGTP pyrophosphatase MutT (NUDIX family)
LYYNCTMTDSAGVVAHPAATVVLLRDGDDGCEALLVRRNVQLSFHGGAWVFPGGRLDPEDYAGVADPTDALAAARNAAVREALEEAGVTISRDGLIALSRWVTPVGLPKRFDTWFFAARALDERVQVDGGEIHEHRWMRPEVALAAQRSGEIELVGYTPYELRNAGAFVRLGQREERDPRHRWPVYPGRLRRSAGATEGNH